jgi:hypothetical protein
MITPHEETSLYLSSNGAYIYTPKKHVYSKAAAPASIDRALEALEERGIELPVGVLLVSEPYVMATRNLETANRVGIADIAGTRVYHTIYSGPHYEWQMWVDHSDTPLPRRIAITDTFAPNRLRTIITTLDWDLEATFSDDAFVFTPPEDAAQIEFLSQAPGKH